jgi:hypothetical protein
MGTLRYVVVSTPRSATSYTAQLLSAAGLRCSHERYFSPKRRLFTDASENLFGEASWLAAPFLTALPEDTLILHQVRDPVRTVNSLIHTRICDPARLGCVTSLKPVPTHANPFALFLWCHTPFPSIALSDTQLAIFFWCHWHRLIEQMSKGRPYLRYRVEDMSSRLLHDLSMKIAGSAKVSLIDEAMASVSRDSNHRGIVPQVVTYNSLGDDARQLAVRYGYRPQ